MRNDLIEKKTKPGSIRVAVFHSGDPSTRGLAQEKFFLESFPIHERRGSRTHSGKILHIMRMRSRDVDANSLLINKQLQFLIQIHHMIFMRSENDIR